MGAVSALALGWAVVGTTPAAATSYPVTSLVDGDPGALRDAIDEANANTGPDVIDIGVTGTYLLNPEGGPLVITDDVTITGPGADDFVVDADHEFGVFEVRDTANVIISGITIMGGNADAGGGVFVCSSEVELLEVDVVGNDGYEIGGGVFADSTSTLTIGESTIGELGEGGANSAYYGGGVAFGEEPSWNPCEGGLTQRAAALVDELPTPGMHIYDTTIVANDGWDAGGGVHLAGSGDVLIERTAIIDNAASDGAGVAVRTGFVEVGGPPTTLLRGSMATLTQGTAVIENTTISGNRAEDLGGGI